MANNTSGDPHETHAPSVRTFLLADVRGYTRYSDERGDEAASALARRFADIVHQAVQASGGELVEVRGDEALCVFGSAREATWAAVELQRRFREKLSGEPALPLPVGIGMDAGEAVATEGGYKGRALNVAARLCSLAGPGAILASETVALLAGRDDRARYAPRRPTRMKGIAAPVRFVEVVPQVELPPLPVAARPRREVRRRRALVMAVALALITAVLAAILILRRDDSGGVVVPPNSVALIDPSSNRIVDSIRVGDSPGPIDAATGALWVLNRNNRTLTKIDPRTREVVDTVGLGTGPANMSAGASGVWVTDVCGQTLLRIDPRRGRTQRVALNPQSFFEGPGYFRYCAVNADAGPIWAASVSPASLVRVDVDPASGTAAPGLAVPVPGHHAYGIAYPVGGASAIAVDNQAVWAVDYEGGVVRRVDPAKGKIVGVVNVGEGPVAAAAGDGFVWVVNQNEDSVSLIEARTNSVRKTLSVGDVPTAVGLGEGAVWVANSGDGTVSRIDPETNEVVATISIGNRPQGIIVAQGLVWVTVRKA